MGSTVTKEEKERYWEQRAQDLGMVKTFTYHCKRCNYIWLPKDFEFGRDNIAMLDMPKSCARCKSKYWRQERVNREAVTRDIPMKPLYDWVEKVVKQGRKDGLDDRTIASTIVTYGRKGNYSNFQISEVLRYNGVNRYSRHN